MTNLKKTILTTLLGLTLALGVFTAEAKEKSAQEAVEKAASEMMVFVKKQNGTGDIDTGEVEAFLSPIIDFDGIAKAVVGKHSQAMTPAQIKSFNKIFKETMVNLYKKSLTEFKITDITVEPISGATDSKAVATMRVKEASGDSYTINYSLRRVGDNWMVRNVILDGVNMGLTYRNQFNSAMTQYNGNIDKVFDSWTTTVNGELASK